jgi:hypothetical protein
MHPKNCSLPLPLEPILNSPTLAVTGAAVHGAVLSIVLAHWRGECRGPPVDEAGLAALSRCYGAQWSRVRLPVKLALAEITPQLASAMRVCCVPDRRGRRLPGLLAWPAP